MITASVTVDGKTYTAEFTVTVGSFSIEIAFAQERYDLEAGGAATEVFAMSVTATLNDEPWNDWAQYTTFTSGNAAILKIEGGTVTVLGTGSTTVTASFSYAGISRTDTAEVELWTQLIDSEDEFLALGAYKDGAIADWSGRYLITKDLDFTGKTVTQLGNVTGTIDGGGHALKHIELAATGNGLTNNTTKEGDRPLPIPKCRRYGHEHHDHRHAGCGVRAGELGRSVPEFERYFLGFHAQCALPLQKQRAERH